MDLSDRRPMQRLGEPVAFFILTASFFGILNCFLVPPFQVPDEFQHFYRAFSVSEFKLLPKLGHNDVGDFLPASLKTISEPFMDIPHHASVKTSAAAICDILTIPLQSQSREWISYPGSSIYVPFAYFPQAAALTLHRLDIPPAYLFYLGRLSALAFWVFTIALAIRLIPHSKWILVVLALSPMSLFQAASFSADVVTNALAILAVSVFFHLLDRGEPLRRRQVFAIFCLTLAVSLCKIAYIPLMGIFLFLPRSCFGNKTFRAFFVECLALANLLVPLLWTSTVSAFSPFIPFGVDPRTTVQYALEHPLRAAYIIIQSIISGFSQQFTRYIGVLGWLDTPLPPLTRYAWVATLAALVLSHDPKRQRVPALQAGAALLLGLISYSAIYTLLFIACTQPGSYSIFGVQGRYFIPIGPFIFISIAYFWQMMLGNKSLMINIDKYFPYRSATLMILSGSSLSLFWRYFGA